MTRWFFEYILKKERGKTKMKKAKVIVSGVCRGECCTSCQSLTGELGYTLSPNSPNHIIIPQGSEIPNVIALDGRPIENGGLYPISVNGRTFCTHSRNGGPLIFAEIVEREGKLFFNGIRCRWR